MSSKYLGKQFDIHTGGIDHIPVHHTNEIAQAEGAFNVHPWVKYWMHGEFLILDKGKMAKSEENFLTLRVLEEKKFSALDFRFFCLGAHYRQPLTFNEEGMRGAKNSFYNLRQKIIEIKESTETMEETKENKIKRDQYETLFLEYINDDLNMPKALALMWDVIKDNKLSNTDKFKLIMEFDKIFSLDLGMIERKKHDLPKQISKLAEERWNARKEKKWDKADELRDKIKEKGYEIIDRKDSYKIRKCRS